MVWGWDNENTYEDNGFIAFSNIGVFILDFRLPQNGREKHETTVCK